MPQSIQLVIICGWLLYYPSTPHYRHGAREFLSSIPNLNDPVGGIINFPTTSPSYELLPMMSSVEGVILDVVVTPQHGRNT